MPDLRGFEMEGEVNEHETGFLTFLAEPIRGRASTLLGLGPKRRKDVRALLDHKIQLDPRFARAVSGSEHNAAGVTRRLRSLGAPEACWILSARSDLDGRKVPLDEGIAAVFDSMSGGFASCVPGKLGFFQYEAPSRGYLLVR